MRHNVFDPARTHPRPGLAFQVNHKLSGGLAALTVLKLLPEVERAFGGTRATVPGSAEVHSCQPSEQSCS